jgi:propionyl-CoA carboxylase beta chain
MSSKILNGDYNFAWSSAQVAVMGAQGAVQIISKGGNISEQRLSYEEHFDNPL